MVGRDRNYSKYTHILPTGGRRALLYNNTQWKQYAKQSQSLFLSSGNGCYGMKGTKANECKPVGGCGVCNLYSWC